MRSSQLVNRARSTVLSAAAAVALVFFGVNASAIHFSNSTLDDVRFGPEQASGGSSLDLNIAKFNLGIDGDGGNFATTLSALSYTASIYYLSSGRFVYSFRSIAGSFSNENEAGTQRALVQWLMTEPDVTRRSLSGATLHQRHDVMVRVALYTTATPYPSSGYGVEEVEDCAVKATTNSPTDPHTDPNTDIDDPASVRIALKCRRDALFALGFSEDQIEAIEDALGARGINMRYIWQDSGD